MSTGTGRRRDRPVRAETVARAALALVNSDGLDSLTMRRLATSLDVQLPTIYRLFGSKQALLDEMSETLLAAVPERLAAPGGGVDWRESAASLARGLRAVLLEQRDGARIVGGSYSAKRPTLTLVETALSIMHEAGFPAATALWANTTLFCYVLGEVLEQQGSTGDERELLTEAVRGGEFPRLAAAPAELLLDFDARFEFGLNVVLTGLHAAVQR